MWREARNRGGSGWPGLVMIMDSRIQSKLEYWDESYPDFCRTLHRDWELTRQRESMNGVEAAAALRELVRTEVSRNPSLLLYVRECLGASRSAEQRLQDDILAVPHLKVSSGGGQFAGV